MQCTTDSTHGDLEPLGHTFHQPHQLCSLSTEPWHPAPPLPMPVLDLECIMARYAEAIFGPVQGGAEKVFFRQWVLNHSILGGGGDRHLSYGQAGPDIGLLRLLPTQMYSSCSIFHQPCTRPRVQCNRGGPTAVRSLNNAPVLSWGQRNLGSDGIAPLPHSPYVLRASLPCATGCHLPSSPHSPFGWPSSL